MDRYQNRHTGRKSCPLREDEAPKTAQHDKNNSTSKYCEITRKDYYQVVKQTTWRKYSMQCARKDIICHESHCLRRNVGERRSPRNALLIASLFILLTVTEAAVKRVPDFLDIEAGLEKSQCMVREEVADLRKIHPTLPPDAIYIPSCVVLNRCSGCCQSQRLQCKPTSTYVTRMMISQQLLDPPRYEEITLEFVHHGSCACKREDDPTPVCVQKQCGRDEVWNAEMCSCEKVIGLDAVCVERTCPQNQKWNQDVCDCELNCVPGTCAANEMWNSTLCMCVRIDEVNCLRIRCPFGEAWNAGSCSCELKCAAERCGKLEFWNPNACRCQCRPCHPSRLYHVRFNQNLQTCQCTCKAEAHGRAACKRKRAEFNTNTCTCEHSYAKSHRGRRG